MPIQQTGVEPDFRVMNVKMEILEVVSSLLILDRDLIFLVAPMCGVEMLLWDGE